MSEIQNKSNIHWTHIEWNLEHTKFTQLGRILNGFYAGRLITISTVPNNIPSNPYPSWKPPVVSPFAEMPEFKAMHQPYQQSHYPTDIITLGISVLLDNGYITILNKTYKSQITKDIIDDIEGIIEKLFDK